MCAVTVMHEVVTSHLFCPGEGSQVAHVELLLLLLLRARSGEGEARVVVRRVARRRDGVVRSIVGLMGGVFFGWRLVGWKVASWELVDEMDDGFGDRCWRYENRREGGGVSFLYSSRVYFACTWILALPPHSSLPFSQVFDQIMIIPPRLS